MNIENSYVKAHEHLRDNLKAVKTALNGAKGKDRQLILATGAMSIIYAAEMYSITVDETVKAIGGSAHPAVAIRERLNAYFDDIIERYDAYVKDQTHEGSA